MKKIINKIKYFNNSIFGLILKIFISLSLIVYFFYNIEYSNIIIFFEKFSIFNFFILILLTLFRNYFGAFRFYFLLPKDKRIKINELSKHYYIASFFNNFLPTAIGGDIVRVYLLNKYDISKTEATTYIFLERFIGFYGLLFLAFISSFFWKCPADLFLIILISTILYSFSIFLFFLFFLKRDISFSFLKKIQDILILYKSKNELLVFIYSFFLSLIYQFISVLISYFFSFVLYPTISIIPFLTLVPLVWLITMVPISFGGIGIREVSFVVLLELIGISNDNALIISLGTYLSLIISSLLGIFYYFNYNMNIKKLKG